ncbi:DUF6161 domain-containing protein [Variovorax sp. J22P168]|uniref:DUF6161 domain-containing protein n=1 Tax=Variovorax jilinensis TaxID=3053513 RepID=UPI0025785A7D|nr:DUF6161 domain-containing protein [Variovorax sp. J22P168]MDM0012000.1 DUF6161 domain-containing protein [Variovorax sp. J22P168]
MTEETKQESIGAPNEPLFDLDLGANGGRFAPTSIEEMERWVETEYQAWVWVLGTPGVDHRSVLDYAYQPINEALHFARQSRTYAAQSNDQAAREQISQVSERIREAFQARTFPHSTSSLGQRVLELSAEDQIAGVAYLYAQLPPVPGQVHRFDARDLAGWRGLVTGLAERYEFASNHEPAIRAQRNALELLHERAETLIGEKRITLDGLHRSYEFSSRSIADAMSDQESRFSALLSSSDEAYRSALADHHEKMESTQKAFREGMALRAPVEYWKTKARTHAEKAEELLKASFIAMGLLAVVLCLAAWWTLAGTSDFRKFAVMILLGTLGIWAIRLIVRMFLSNSHLATDAEERVTMVQTYLSLLEEGKMESGDDRKLILAPLFRPASDGLVKDEGLPHPILELLTRQGK